ncbi:M48 family metallopeptidase [Halorarum halobium]|uniref:M48 family metallopeptidase n=1 Tax=Halorarum halobium TaxID=3075121 RepID=UPI0028AE31DB|nr:M48 family metalloprotease [Halobaculum sp. XH14]
MSPVEALSAWLLSWWELWAIVVAGVLGTGLAPLVVGRTESTTPLASGLAESVAAAGVPAERVRVLAGDRGPVAFAAGFSPGHGRVFVSERLVADLSPDQVAAVVRHEYGHLARRHVPLRIAVPVAFAVTWAVGATVAPVPGFLVGAALVLPAAYFTVRVSRWSERDADRFAAARADGGALAAALDSLASAGHVAEGGRLSRHPPLSTRVTRLEERAERSELSPRDPTRDSVEEPRATDD